MTASATIAAIRNLRPSGEKSFEEFIARQLSKLTGERIRRCTAGSQGGVDAVSDIPFAIEDKRYARAVRSRELEGGLTSAAGAYPDLQLWVLVATCAVGAQTRDAVVDAGRRQGVGVLLLDASTTDPDMPGVTALAALAATDVQTTLDTVTDRTWRTGRRAVDANAIRRELLSIRKLPAFRTWKARLRRELQDLPTWRRLVRAQNEWLFSTILGDAANAFGTRYDACAAVPRTAERELSTWWNSSTIADACHVGIVLGDRYDGKTWLVYHWLSTQLPRQTIPVFLFSSAEVQTVLGDVETLIMRQCERALGSFARHASAVVARHRERQRGAGPWCLVVLDGANEYAAAPQALAAAMLRVAPPPPVRFRDDPLVMRPGEEDDDVEQFRRCGLLITCRARDFDDDHSWLGSRPMHRIELGPFDSDEFRDALARHGLTPEDVANMPSSARDMLRRPRYLDLLLAHRADIIRYGVVTADVLQYLDASDKVAAHEVAAVRRSPAAFKTFLGSLAKRWLKGGRVTHGDVWADLKNVTEGVDVSLRGLISEGVLIPRADGTVQPDLDRLALGMGLFLRDHLLTTPEGTDLRQAVLDLLDPHRDDDEKARWLRAALTTSLLAGDHDTRPEIVQTLLGTWLSSRNFSSTDVDDLRVLAPRLLRPTLELLSTADAHAEIVFAFAEPIIAAGMEGDEARVARTLRAWCRLVPIGFPRYIGDSDGEDPALVRARIADSSLADLGLTLPTTMNARTVRACQRLALFLAVTQPALLGVKDILALLGARDAAGDHLSDGERYAVRIVLRAADFASIRAEILTSASDPIAARTRLLRALIAAADQRDLVAMLATLPERGDVVWQPHLTRSDLASLRADDDDKATVRLAERARELAIDPTTPPPSRKWRAALAAAATRRFEGSKTLCAFNCTSRDDLDLEHIEPALAAWAPAVAARIWKGVIKDIPRRASALNEDTWSWMLDGHAALLTATDRRLLLRMIRAHSGGAVDVRHALHRTYCCILAGVKAVERLRLLMEHPFDQEWTTLYKITAAPREVTLRAGALTTLRRTRNARHLRRACNLLGWTGGALSARDVARLTAQLVTSDARDADEAAVHFLLANVVVADTTPLTAFGQLPEPAESAADAAWQYSAFLDRQSHGGRLTGIGLARALAAPHTARRRGLSSAVADKVAVEDGIRALAREVCEELERSFENPVFSEGPQFPDTIADALTHAEYDAWVRVLLALPHRARYAHVGELMAVVPRALRTRHAAARQLWARVYPFQRTRVAFGTRFTVQRGLDWTLRLIHAPSLDDALARSLLHEIVADCRSDGELMAIALGARLASTARLTAVVMNALASDDATMRARARFVAGWMPDDAALRRRLAASDASLWVERIGRHAIARLDRERWAREWLRRFLRGRTRVECWAAGRLFLACADAATPFWAERMLYATPKLADPTRRAEATLLLSRVRTTPDDSAFRDTFLGHRVRELAAVVPPWREPADWEDVQERSPE